MIWADRSPHGLQVKVIWYDGSCGRGAIFAASESGTVRDELWRRNEAFGHCVKRVGSRCVGRYDSLENDRDDGLRAAAKDGLAAEARNNVIGCMMTF